MDCSQFQEIVQELARGGQPGFVTAGLGDGPRASALAHARMCAACDSLLAEASALTVSLRALALRDARAEAPASLEASMVAAYRQNRGATAIPISGGNNVSARWRIPAAFAGLSIAAALALSLFLYRPWRHLAPPQAAMSQAMTPATQQPQNAVRSGHLRPDNGQPAHVLGHGAARIELPQLSAMPSQNQPVKVASANKANNLRNRNFLEDISSTTGSFMPLPYADAGPVEDATLVRMVIPGTALGALGLPVTDGSAEGRVVADFIVGEDGTPEAIRIVR